MDFSKQHTRKWSALCRGKALTDYSDADAHWRTLWAAPIGWTSPWFPPAPDGNPIFTAISRDKASRVIQYEPTSPLPECDWWFDKFDDIDELVIACTLEASGMAAELMTAWIAGDEFPSRQSMRDRWLA